MPPLNKLQKTGLALAISQSVCTGAQAATITVNNSGDNGEGCTFREAVELINTAGGATGNGCQSTVSAFGNNDRILFDVDTIIGLTSEVVISKDVNINPNGEKVTISSDGTDRVLTITNAASVNIDRLVVTEGNARVSDGGGLAVLNDGNGGGILVGANATLLLNNSVITNNQAASDGGGVFIADGASLSLNNSTISNNTAQRFGGGIGANPNSELTISNSTLNNNIANANGGGIVFRSFAKLLITNSTISGNTTAGGGGGIYSDTRASADAAGETLTMINSTITQNIASDDGGGLRIRDVSLTLQNNLILGNQAGNPRFNEFIAFSQSLANSSISQNLIGQQFGIEINLQTDNIIVNADELPDILSPLADNGGPTLTHALPAGSPAIDAGDSAICAAAPINNLDQRGEPRDANCDIGAFEFIEPEDGGFFVIPLKNGKTVVIPE